MIRSTTILILIISFFIIGGTQAQSKKSRKKVTLNAKVLDIQRNPIQNASVFVDGKKTNAKSDAEGKFKIKLKPTVKSITVFTLFHGVAETVYNGETNFTFILYPSVNEEGNPLKETEEDDMVNVGYGKTEKRNLSTSVGSVSKSRLKSTRNYTNIYDMIKGEVPGVVVSGNSITIRGMASINLSNEPLYVVDGSPTSNISNISPSDVKSISILKGASAAIYGSRGANGVVVITLRTANDD